MAQAHGEQVPHRGLFQVLRHIIGQLLRERVHQPLLQSEQALFYGDANGGGGEALACGVDVPAAGTLPGVAGGLFTVLGDHDTQGAKGCGGVDELG